MGTENAKARVLIVDDNPANRLAFEITLERDHVVLLAETGRQALELAEREEVEVVLIDIRMPIMDGYEVAAELRRRERTRHTPILFTSAVERTPHHVARGFEAGATDFILSPVDPDLLRGKVRQLVETHRRRKTLKGKILELSDVLRGLRAELARTLPHDQALSRHIRQLEELSEALRRQSVGLESEPRRA
jgi:PleD family two-component response regulator